MQKFVFIFLLFLCVFTSGCIYAVPPENVVVVPSASYPVGNDYSQVYSDNYVSSLDSSNILNGYGNSVDGRGNIVNGNYNTVIGDHNIVTGDYLYVVGNGRIVNG